MDKKLINLITMLLIIGFISGVASADTLIQVSLINQNPSKAVAGNIVDVTFGIENSGSTNAQDVVLEVLPKYPFTLADNSAVQNLQTISAYQLGQNRVIVNYKLLVDKDVPDGNYDLPVRYKYGTNQWIAKTVSIQVTGQEFTQILVDKSRLDPGKETNISFRVTNVGTSPLKNLLFSWTESTGIILPVYSDNTKYVNYLDAGASIDLKYVVVADVNAKPGLYPININLNFESASNSNITFLQSKVGMFIGGGTDFDVAFSQSSQGQTSLSVANIGNTPALSVSVRVPQQAGYRISGSDTSIIGNLDKGDYTLVSFQIVAATSGNTSRNFTGMNGQRGTQTNISQDAGQGFQRGNLTRTGTDGGLRVLIDYTDTAGERKTVEKTVSIQFRDATATSGLTTGARTAASQTNFIGSTSFYLLIAALIIIGVIYVKRKSIFGNNKK